MTIDEYKRLLARESRKESASEHELQVACVKWFRYEYPQFSRLLFAIPNGGQRDVVVASKLKSEGVVAGVPDMFLALPNEMAAGLFIEMKNGRAGRVSRAQEEMMHTLKRAGYECDVCRSYDEFVTIVRKYLRFSLQNQ